MAALSAVAVAILVFTACSENNRLVELKVRQLDEFADSDIINNIIASGDKGIPFPEGSKAYRGRDGYRMLVLPTGYYWVVVPENNRQSSFLSSQVSFKCNCKEGNTEACYPAELEGMCFCLIADGCHGCDRENDASPRESILAMAVGLLSQQSQKRRGGTVD